MLMRDCAPFRRAISFQTVQYAWAHYTGSKNQIVCEFEGGDEAILFPEQCSSGLLFGFMNGENGKNPKKE